MQIFLWTSNMTITLNEFSRVTYDGQVLRTYFHGKQATERSAKTGECYYITPNGVKKPPTVKKAKMPKLRGQKIAWALAFSTKNALCNSFDEFWHKVNYYKNENGEESILFVKKDTYGIAFTKSEGKKLLKPLAAYIYDRITEEELHQLIKDFTDYRPLFCPVEFLYLQ